jgi:hypothetical protein
MTLRPLPSCLSGNPHLVVPSESTYQSGRFVIFDNPNPQLQTGQEGAEKTRRSLQLLKGANCQIVGVAISSNGRRTFP